MSWTERGPGARRRPDLVAHRGASKDAPENTLAAFRLGLSQGAEAIEGDFWLSADGVLVAMHDQSLARTAGDPRLVTDLELTQIRALDVGRWGPFAQGGYAGEGVPTLAEVLALIAALEGRGLFIEIKDGPRAVPALLETLAHSGVSPTQIAIIAFDVEVLAAVAEQGPEWTRYWLCELDPDAKGRADGAAAAQTAAEVLRRVESVGARGVDVGAQGLAGNPEFVARMREAGLEVHGWTVDEGDLARRLAALGLDSITTNEPARLREALAVWESEAG